ncbi:MAG: hypothetical protein K9N23_01090 [Akkermansiaceae bacterium]|nr:hypothetical protein [Akkermansiaceae bacterium]
MSVETNDLREALFVFCLASCVLPSSVSAAGDWNQSRPDPRLSEVDLGDDRILVPCFD